MSSEEICRFNDTNQNMQLSTITECGTLGWGTISAVPVYTRVFKEEQFNISRIKNLHPNLQAVVEELYNANISDNTLCYQVIKDDAGYIFINVYNLVDLKDSGRVPSNFDIMPTPYMYHGVPYHKYDVLGASYLPHITDVRSYEEIGVELDLYYKIYVPFIGKGSRRVPVIWYSGKHTDSVFNLNVDSSEMLQSFDTASVNITNILREEFPENIVTGVCDIIVFTFNSINFGYNRNCISYISDISYIECALPIILMKMNKEFNGFEEEYEKAEQQEIPTMHINNEQEVKSETPKKSSRFGKLLDAVSFGRFS